MVPHPDDEVLIMGGLLRTVLGMAGCEQVIVIAVTDGEAAYPTMHRSELAAVRRTEQDRALELLCDKRRPEVIRLGLPDSGVSDYETALTCKIRDILDPEWLLVAPWMHDHHSDHEACGRAARRAAELVGCQLASGLFWSWQHPPIDPSPPLRRLRLAEDTVTAKRHALNAHSSQIDPEPPLAPVVTSRELAPLAWSSEYYFLSGPVAS